MKYLSSAPIVFGPPKNGWVSQKHPYGMVDVGGSGEIGTLAGVYIPECSHPNQKLVGDHWRCERCGAEIAVQG